MGKKDMKDRLFFSDKERFAELINQCVYHGERILLSENLEFLKRKYPSLTGTSGEKERDIVVRDQKSNICYGLEIETESDYSMPERVMVYDACEYEYQIKEIDKKHMSESDYDSYREKKSRMKENDFLLPIITVVLYLGEGHWKSRCRLTEMFPIQIREWKLQEEYLNEYNFPLIEADFVNPENYRTDLREFFQAMQCRQDREQLASLFQAERFQNLSIETVQEIAVHLRMKGLIWKIKREVESVAMCKAVDDWLADERNKGRQEGIKEGEMKGVKKGIKEGKKKGKKEEKLQIIKRMQAEGMEESLIRRVTKCTKAELAAAAGE